MNEAAESSEAALSAKEWVWALNASIREAKAARIEAQHLESSTRAALEHGAFSPKHDERVVRFKAQTCLSTLSRLLPSVSTLEAHAIVALQAHAADEVWWKQHFLALKEMLKRCQAEEHVLLAELQLEEAAREVWEAEQQRIMRTAFESSLEQLAAQSEQAQDALIGEIGALREENAAVRQTAVSLRGDAARSAEALAREKEDRRTRENALQRDIAELREENTDLRETAGGLRTTVALSVESLAAEKRTTSQLRDKLLRAELEAVRLGAEVDGYRARRQREREHFASYVSTLHAEFGVEATAASFPSVVHSPSSVPLPRSPSF